MLSLATTPGLDDAAGYAPYLFFRTVPSRFYWYTENRGNRFALRMAIVRRVQQKRRGFVTARNRPIDFVSGAVFGDDQVVVRSCVYPPVLGRCHFGTDVKVFKPLIQRPKCNWIKGLNTAISTLVTGRGRGSRYSICFKQHHGNHVHKRWRRQST